MTLPVDDAPPRDSLDLRTIRDGGRRAIPWDAAIELDAARRRVVAANWFARMKQEHLAVGAFARIALELAEVGCESVVLALITRAAADEVRHADVCKRLAQALFGDDVSTRVPERLRGVPSVPSHPHATTRERALFHVVEMCCLNETFTGVYLTEMLERATHPTARAAIESLLEDEIDHGRVGWAHLAACCREGWGVSAVERALPSLLERAIGTVFDAARERPEADDRALEAHGYLGTDTGAEVHRRGFADVVLPGFESVGIDVGPARALANARGWS